MKTRFLKQLALVAAAAVLALAGFGTALSEEYTAGTMRLLHYEGTVEIENAAGSPRFVMENVRFGSGEAMRTGESSMASVGLDDSKILTMDAESRVEFIKEGNHMLLTLTAGSLFLDVKEKLDENETLNIQTNTMVVGIRGTALYVTVLDRVPESFVRLISGPDEDQPVLTAEDTAPQELREVLHTGFGGGGQVAQVGVLSGKVSLLYRDEQNIAHTVNLDAGLKATLVDQNENELVDIMPAVSDITPEDLKGFREETVISDPELYERVIEDTKDLLPPIALFSESAEKVYDGLSLTNGRVKAVGLPEGYTVDATVTGSQTDAGTAENTISGYRVFDQARRDVTDRFQDIALYFGKLEVYPAPLTVVTVSASKAYDGKPLTAEGGSLIGLEKGETASVKATGSITAVDKAPNTYEIEWGSAKRGNYTLIEQPGTLEVTVNDTPIRFTASSARKVYDGTPLTGRDVTAAGLPEGLSFRAGTSGSQTKAGTGVNSVAFRRITDADGNDVTAFFSDITDISGSLTVEPLELAYDLSGASVDIFGNLQIPHPTITYLNGPHAGETTVARRTRGQSAGFVFSLFTGDTVHLTVTVTETEEGAYSLLLESTFPGGEGVNFDLSSVGPISIPKPEPLTLTITTASAAKPYDGLPLTSPGVTVSGLAEGDAVTVTATGSVTDVGAAENTFAIDWGDTDPARYTVAADLGMLEVTPNGAAVAFTAASAEKVYDSLPLADSTVTGSGLPESLAWEATAAGSRTDAGESVNAVASYAIYDKNGRDVTASFTNIASVDGRLKITPAPVTVVTGSASKGYDGTPLTKAEASITGLVNGETAAVTATGSITDIGTAVNTYDVAWGTAKEGNYTITEELGTLEVTANAGQIIFTAASAEKVYDGTALTASGVTAAGLPEGLTWEAAAAGSITDAGESGNEITSYAIFDAGGTDVTASFADIALVNGRLTVTPAEVTVTTGSASKPYDGTPLTNAEASITGLVNGETATVTATGSITDIGTAVNTYDVAWGTAKADNYTITEELGTLEVTANAGQITFTAASAEKVYDGTALTASGVTAAGLPEGLTWEAAAAGSITDAGDSGNVITSYAIFDAGGTDVTASFADIVTVNGRLTVTPAEVTVTTGSASKPYDGTPLTKAEASITGLVNGETAAVTATGVITDAGTAENTYDIAWGTAKEGNYTVTEELGALSVDPLDISVHLFTSKHISPLQPPELTYNSGSHAGETIVGTASGGYSSYHIFLFDLHTGDRLQVSFTWTNGAYDEISFTFYGPSSGHIIPGDNYSVAYSIGKIEKKVVTVTTSSEEKVFDGTPLTGTASITGLYEEDEGYITVAAVGSITDVGSVTNEYSIDWGDGDSSTYYDYEFVYHLGTLTVSPRPVVIATGSAEKVYDGMALTCNEASITGLAACDEGRVTVTATGTITDAGTAPNTYAIDWGGVDPGNYTVTENLGTLTVEPLIEIIVSTASASKVYDGTPLTDAGVSVSGLRPEDEGKVTVTATGSQTKEGSSPNTCVIDWGDADPGRYTVTQNLGTLTVDELQLNFAIGSVTVDYRGVLSVSGTPYPPVTLTVGNGAHAGETIAYNSRQFNVSGDNVSAAVYFFEFPAGDGFALKISGFDPQAGTHTLTGSFSGSSSFPSTTLWNYGVSITPGTFTVNPLPMTVTTGSASKYYDGTPLTCPEASVSGLGPLDDPEQVTVTATGTITNVGTAQNTYSIDWGTVNPNNYTIIEELGTLKVMRDFAGGSITYTWDGTSGTVRTSGGATFILLDKDAFVAFYTENKGSMSDKQIIQNLLDMGIITWP